MKMKSVEEVIQEERQKKIVQRNKKICKDFVAIKSAYGFIDDRQAIRKLVSKYRLGSAEIRKILKEYNVLRNKPLIDEDALYAEYLALRHKFNKGISVGLLSDRYNLSENFIKGVIKKIAEK